MKPSGVITITTDFGHQGPFVGVMKGVILSRLNDARIVDLTHEIVVHWPAEAGFWLLRAFKYFPAGTVHIAVAGPGDRVLHKHQVFPSARDMVRRISAYWAMSMVMRALREAA